MGLAAIEAAVVGALGSLGVDIEEYNTIAVNLDAGNSQEIVAAPGAGKQIWVYGYGFTVDSAGSVAFKDSDGTARSGIMPMEVGMVCPPSGSLASPIMKFGTNRAVYLDIVTSELDGWLAYGIVRV